MAQIFLSYSRKDGNEYVAEVQRELETRGYATWRDVRNLHPDQDFTADIEAGIAESSHVVVCVTEDTKRNNSFVRREIQFALAINKSVIPLRCHDTVPHISIINNEWVDYFRDKAQAVHRLTEILNDPRLQNEPGDQPADPFRPYLEAALQSIVMGLQQRIIRQIDLRSKATPDAVNAPERKAQAKPVDIFQLAMSGVKMGGDDESEKVEEKTNFETFAEAFEYYNHRVLLMGEPGAGKTITLMAYAREAYAARLEDPTKPLPLFGLIPTWDAAKQTPLAGWLAETYGLDKTDVQQVVEQGRALLLLDGLDELGRERPVDPEKPDSEKYDPRLRFVQALPTNNQILMTSRIEDYNDMVGRGDKAALSGAITLQPLGEAQMAEYLTDQPELWQLIQEDAQLREITTTPLLMSFFAFAYQDMSAEERTQLSHLQNALDLRDRIFLGYIEKRYDHERRKINADLPFSYDEILNILGQMAIQSAADWLAASNIITQTRLKTVLFHNLTDFVELIIQLRILIPIADNSFRFIHLLLHDVLAFTQSQSVLSHSDPILRRRATDALAGIKDIRAVNSLISNLRDNDTSVRRRTAEALGRIQSVLAIEPLIAILNDQNEGVRNSAAYALGRIGAPALNPLILALTNPNPIVRNRAAYSLGRIRHLGAIEPLIAALRDTDAVVRRGAADALGRIGDARAVEPLMAALKDTDALVRRHTAATLGRIGDARAVEPLMAALKDTEANVRGNAATTLGRIGDARATEPLIAALKDTDGHIRWNATDALGRIGDAAVEPLMAALKDKDRYVRQGAATSLGMIGDARAVEPLMAALKDKDRYVRQGAATALGELGDTRAVEPLIAALKETDRDVRESAVTALGELEDARAVEPLIAALKDKDSVVPFKAVSALRRISTPEAVEAVEEWEKQKRNMRDYWDD